MVLSVSRRESVAGRSVAGDNDYVCVACGYGVSRCTRLPVCPMCHERVWRPAPPSRAWVGGWAQPESSSLVVEEELNDVCY
jgi:hypothetical protein